MKAAILMLVFAQILLHITNAFYLPARIPFTHDFNKDSRTWGSSASGVHWFLSGQDGKYPDLTKIPSFHSDGNYYWTQKSDELELDMFTSFQSPYIYGVNKTTKFHIRYWFSTSKTAANIGINFYINDSNGLIDTIKASANEWRDFTIDCQRHKCCAIASGVCRVEIFVMASVENSHGGGLVAIRCVSTLDDGCGTLPKTSTSATAINSLATDDVKHSGLSGYTEWGKAITVCLVVIIILVIPSLLLRIYFYYNHYSHLKHLNSNKNNQSLINPLM